MRDFNTRHRVTSPFTVPVSQGCLTDAYAGYSPRVRAVWGFPVGDMLPSTVQRLNSPTPIRDPRGRPDEDGGGPEKARPLQGEVTWGSGEPSPCE